MSDTLERTAVSPVVTPPPSPERGMSLKTKRKLAIWGLRYGAIALVLLAWHLASGRLMAEYLISSPGEVARSFVDGLTEGELLNHTLVTLREIALGYPLGAAAGITVGFVLGSSPILAKAFQPIVTALFGIPIIALAPLIVVWLGIGYASKVGIVALLVFFLTFFNTYSGLKNMDRQYLDLARLMGADRKMLIFKVVLPTVTPAIFAGLAIALPQSVIAATVGEFIAASEGLGFMIRRAAGVFDTPTLIVGALVLMLLVLAANAVLTVIERRVLVWKPQKEGN
jgi:NitT/TauT family transport system permease protein